MNMHARGIVIKTIAWWWEFLYRILTVKRSMIQCHHHHHQIII